MNTETAKTETAARVLPDLTAEPEAKPAEPAKTPAPKKDGKPAGKKVTKVQEKGRQTVKATAPAKAAPAKPAKKLPFPETAKIKILVESNPKRPGSKGAARFDLYKNGMTVAQAIKAGVTAKDLLWDADPKRKFIKIA